MLVAFAFALAISSAAPAKAPPGCKIEALDHDLVVKSGGKEAKAYAEAIFDGAPLFLPSPEKNRVFVAAKAQLFEAVCGAEPSVRLALADADVDFAKAVDLGDGRWAVGAWQGLRVLDLNRLVLAPLTTAPPIEDPKCWAVQAGNAARAADWPLAMVAGDLHFARGGACGYEGDMLMAPMALALERGVVRRVRPVSSFALVGDGRMLVGVAACEGGGGLELSSDGVAWTPQAVAPGGVARLERLAGERWLALTPVCDKGGAKVGGDLYLSEDLASWKQVTAEESASWERAPEPRVKAAPQALAKTLGVEKVLGTLDDKELGRAFAWTSDGLFMREGDGAWARIFPR